MHSHNRCARGRSILLATVLLAPPALAQTWTQQSPFPTNHHIYDLAFTSPSRGYVVGTWRNLVETTNAGQTWTKRMSGGLNSDPFYRITFYDAQRGFVFGNNNDAWRTTNGGTTWTKMTTMLAGSWYYADFVSPTFGVAGCNGAGAYTADGGVTWNLLQGWPDSPFYYGLDMRDASTGLCSGQTSFNSGFSGVQRTTDGGFTWTLVREGPAGEVMWLDSTTALAFFFDGVAGTTVERSTDGGLTWQYWGACPDEYLDKIARVDGANTFVGVVHAVGTVCRSTDGGKTWTRVFAGQGTGGLPSMAPWSFSFPDPDHGYLGGPYGMLFQSLDRGLTWTQLSRGIGEEITGLDMVTDLIGYAVSDHHTLRTTDGGAHWWIVDKPEVTGQVFGRSERGTCIAAVDADFAVMGGDGGIAFRTTDGGQTWDSIGWPWNMHDIFMPFDVHFTDRNNGWMVGSGDPYGNYPSVYRTTDGGNSWSEGAPETLPRALYTDVDFTDPLHGWISVASRVVYRTTDGGQTWTQSVIEADFLSITAMDFAPDGLTGFVTGFYGDVYRTTDGGVTWTNVFFDPTYDERALGISVVSSREAYYTVAPYLGNTQFVRYTTDGGATWKKSNFPAAWESAYLQPGLIEVMPSGRAFVGGYFGIIATAMLPRCAADFNRDGFVDGIDYDSFNNAFEAGDPSADFNGDGFVDGIDYDQFNIRFEAGC